MTDHSKYNNGFTAQDIERYYSGKMSSLEMHQLEKAAMEDPFLADALEGYIHTNTPVQDIEYLQTQLQSKMEQGKVAPIKSFTKNQFLRIAALFILLAGCGWAVYQFGFAKPNTDIAIMKQPNVPSPSITTDTNRHEADLQQSTTDAPQQPEVNTETKNKTTTQTTTYQNDVKGTVSISTQNRHTGKLNNSGLINGNKGQTDEVALGRASAIRKGTRDQAASLETHPVAGNKLKESDSGSVAAAPQTISPGKENVIVLQPSKVDVVPEVTLSKNRRDSNYRKPHITLEEAEPENGTAYYDDYVVQNLQLPEEEMKKNIEGEVKLSFDINDAGEAVNIKVEKSLCTECDKEAIRLLKQGPKWKKIKDKKGKLRIRF